MPIVITINKHNYERVEFDGNNNVISREKHDIKELPETMVRLTGGKEPNDLLTSLRKAYRLFNVRSFTFDS